MGYVAIVSLPMLILFVVLCFACYHMGKRKGQEEGRALASHEFLAANGIAPPLPPPAPPAGTVMPPPGFPPPPPQYFPSPSHNPNPTYVKQENGRSY
ncbi:hypothetical protein ACJRO7_020664 [Eucalyptus globulus]|uniref:Uncharacterized protein n=1 Tax=Eucalyptus globulus TaxID=34317 RepID=A0ABD3KIW4_EUCGL